MYVCGHQVILTTIYHYSPLITFTLIILYNIMYTRNDPYSTSLYYNEEVSLIISTYNEYN